eukprot:jgi/Botrbrau1/5781/Bobra.0155s0004.1
MDHWDLWGEGAGGEYSLRASRDGKIVYTYDVFWSFSATTWASRWDAYLRMPGGRVHWFSIMNSLMVVLIMSSIVAMILMRTVRRDLARYEGILGDGGAKDDVEESGWKMVSGDVFSPPKMKSHCACKWAPGPDRAGRLHHPLLCGARVSVARGPGGVADGAAGGLYAAGDKRGVRRSVVARGADALVRRLGGRGHPYRRVLPRHHAGRAVLPECTALAHGLFRRHSSRSLLQFHRCVVHHLHPPLLLRWRSFMRGGSVSFYIGLYSISFLFNTLHSLSGFLSVLLYLSYMGLVLWAIYLAMGTIGFLSSFYLTYSIFSRRQGGLTCYTSGAINRLHLIVLRLAD